jgi:hypothetical protein
MKDNRLMRDGNQGRKWLGLIGGATLAMAACSPSSATKLVDAQSVSDSNASGTTDLPSQAMGCFSFYAVTGGPFCVGRTWAGAGTYRCLENCEPSSDHSSPGTMTGMFPCMAAYAGDGGSSARDVVCIPAGGCDIYCPEGTSSHD